MNWRVSSQVVDKMSADVPGLVQFLAGARATDWMKFLHASFSGTQRTVKLWGFGRVRRTSKGRQKVKIRMQGTW